MQERIANTPAATYLVLGLVSLAALTVASPWGPSFGATWLPAAGFAIGAGLVTLAFLEAARGLSAWLSRTATIGWIGGAMLVAAGLFAAGSSMMVNARATAFDWVATGGIIVALLGLRWQRRAALR